MIYRIKKWFKESFCDHIWKAEREEYLGTYQRHLVGVYVGYVNAFAVYKKCVKCGKKMTEEVRRKNDA